MMKKSEVNRFTFMAVSCSIYNACSTEKYSAVKAQSAIHAADFRISTVPQMSFFTDFFCSLFFPPLLKDWTEKRSHEKKTTCSDLILFSPNCCFQQQQIFVLSQKTLKNQSFLIAFFISEMQGHTSLHLPWQDLTATPNVVVMRRMKNNVWVGEMGSSLRCQRSSTLQSGCIFAFAWNLIVLFVDLSSLLDWIDSKHV